MNVKKEPVPMGDGTMEHEVVGVPVGRCAKCGRVFEPAELVPRDCPGSKMHEATGKDTM